MSFMFHPHPYADPRAVNPVTPPQDVKENLTLGAIAIAKKIAATVKGGARRIGLDGYPGTQFETLVNVLRQQMGETKLHFVDARSVLKSNEEIAAIVSPYLPEDREIDPVLLYGIRYEEGYQGLQDAQKVEALCGTLESTGEVMLVAGQGALVPELRGAYDLKIWADITPKQAALNFKFGKAWNLGCDAAMPYAKMMRRNYYVDFESALSLRWELIRKEAIDLYISADDPDKAQMLPFAALKKLFDELIRRPLRCRPVYLEGVWGGFYIKNLRHLPEEMRNCAWVFDMIPMEVSLVADMGGRQMEVPFFTFVQTQGRKLLGNAAFETFGGYFPVRFNYDDTYHANGNMSIQCHPDEKYVVENHRELGRQDESYYICVTGQEACTYLGFEKEESCEAFLAEAGHAEKTGALIDYKRHVHAVKSYPGMQVMIPAGTIHASGRNQLILEIGSLTVGSYTYKLYDYQRIDPQSGLPRPIHLQAGRKVLRKERTKQWVEENLVDHGRVLREGEGWQEKIVGEHELLYFSLRNLVFEKSMEDDTKNTFHVLALVDGERVRVESVEEPGRYFRLLSFDIVVVPATFGRYRIVNEGVGAVTVHKTMLKDGFEGCSRHV